MNEFVERTTDEVVGSIRKQPVGGAVREEHTAVAIEHADRVRGVLEESGKPGLADAEGIVGPLALERVGQGLTHLAQESDFLVAPFAGRPEHADAEIADEVAPYRKWNRHQRLVGD